MESFKLNQSSISFILNACILQSLLPWWWHDMFDAWYSFRIWSEGFPFFFQSFFSASSKIFRDFKGSRIDILIGLALQQPSSSIELFSMRLGLAFHQERIFNHALTVWPTYAITPAVLCNETISFKFQNLFQCLWIWNKTIAPFP